MIRGVDNTRATPAVAARAPAARRPALDQPGGRRDQLRDARARPADARLRPRAAARRPARRARARAGERVQLLDGQRDRRSTRDVLVIADDASARSGSPASWAGSARPISAQTRPTCCSRSAWFTPDGDRGPRAPLRAADRCQPALRARRRSGAGRSGRSSARRRCCWRSRAAPPVPVTTAAARRRAAAAHGQVTLRRTQLQRLLGAERAGAAMSSSACARSA